MRLSIACADRVLVSPAFLPFHEGFTVGSFFFSLDPLFAVPLQPRLLRCYPPLGEVVPSSKHWSQTAGNQLRYHAKRS